MKSMTFGSAASRVTLAVAVTFLVAGPSLADMDEPAPRPKIDCTNPVNKNKPVCAPKNSQLSDDQIYEQAYWKAKKGEYKDALAIAATAKNQDDPRILRVTGFSTRKLGDVDGAFPYYQKALSINPDDTKTREYMGEAFLTKGDLANARQQLGEIQKRCGTGCEDYAKLSDAIDTHVKSNG
jgi:tetratricopeptide (TPR) repeat protein